MTSSQPDFEAIKQRQRNTWASGDYASVASYFIIVPEILCETLDLRSTERVLDVATGTGNAALSAARRFCQVTGVDYVPRLLAYAQLRAGTEVLKADFVEGDAEKLPFPDASFDVVLSTFGVIFAPNQEQAASELLRVCRPGGRIGLTAWTPEGFVGHLQRLLTRFVPPPPNLLPPILWGTEKRLEELLGQGISSLSVRRRNYNYRFPSAQAFVTFYRAHFGPVHQTFAALGPDDQKRLELDLVALLQQFNQSDDTSFAWPAEYLEVVATLPI